MRSRRLSDASRSVVGAALGCPQCGERRRQLEQRRGWIKRRIRVRQLVQRERLDLTGEESGVASRIGRADRAHQALRPRGHVSRFGREVTLQGWPDGALDQEGEPGERQLAPGSGRGASERAEHLGELAWRGRRDDRRDLLERLAFPGGEPLDHAAEERIARSEIVRRRAHRQAGLSVDRSVGHPSDSVLSEYGDRRVEDFLASSRHAVILHLLYGVLHM
jgi:hypothetical protein